MTTPAVTESGRAACDEGCCLVVEDHTLPGFRHVYSRPMYQVLSLRIRDIVCGPDWVCDPMRVRAEDYNEPDGILL